MIKNFKWLLLVSLTFMACNSDDDVAPVTESTDGKPLTSGSADFSKYVALGDSFAAGFSDNALFIKGQQGAYTNIIAQQFALITNATFSTPLTSDNIGGLLLGGNIISGPRLYFNGKVPVPVDGVPTTEVTAHLSGAFNNLGVPGARSYHLVAPGYGNVAGVATGKANPYFARFASSPNTTVLADAIAQSPTFFSLWIGGNDVLGYATSGGTGKDQTGNMDPSTYSGSDITDPTVFKMVYSNIINGLTAKGAKGVIANLPNITSLPYFTTVPYNPVGLTAEKAAQLNAGYAAYNGGLQQLKALGLINADEVAKRTINFVVGSNPVVIDDSYLTNLSAYGLPSYRQATKDDLVVLTAMNFIGTLVGEDPSKVNGVSVPLADKWVLTKDEIAEVARATKSYNETIVEVATAKNLAILDTEALMKQIAGAGITVNGFTVKSTFVTGGAFSLDGVHPSPRGYALIANKFIEAINAKYGSNLNGVNIGNYPVMFPKVL
ncbi:G-D-S-L family lipolytic protein [Flavobacterium nitrogenifigens]|uniref:GDSL-like Lipase/Acylhydrolase n=1 Tax=Flavobacterium nitrogenifigens TaxID=1617283 RepID=A0A521D1Y0_9FLAO|nr:G-D-S-L family lipolytic protein [Flavobacterium nitrogenifigens]KAF2332049.1 G-D-S-L family lipolytic protein [Flavobacterium nitrogenifigens]SMO65011.1 GDSL-like Lipase/Acylhydrolase [Flavobacterium nitrogenifigens]